MKIRVVDGQDSQEKEIDLDDIRFFGTEVEKTYKKSDGEFKSFIVHTWVKESGFRLYPTEMKISDLKKYFKNYDCNKKVVVEQKGDKQKKATEWSCEVLDEGVVSLNREQIEMVDYANKNKNLITLKNTDYYHIMDKVFRCNGSDNHNYYYFDKEKGKLVDMKMSMLNFDIKKSDLEDWIKNYENKE